jgi:hypothetical protein
MLGIGPEGDKTPGVVHPSFPPNWRFRDRFLWLMILATSSSPTFCWHCRHMTCRGAADPPSAFSFERDFACDGALRMRAASSLFSSRVARCRSLSAVSHTMSDIASLGSIFSKC